MALSRARGISIGSSRPIPAVRVPAVRGPISDEEALRRLLAGTGLHAVRIGAHAFRIERDPAPPPPAVARPRPPAEPRPRVPIAVAAEPIVVTARKRAQSLSETPLSVAVVPGDLEHQGLTAADAADVGMLTDGLTVTNLGPGQNRQFIRGVADSPFNGPTQSTVFVQLDEARLTFDAADPNLRLVDVDRIEILKGPQGPLYGSGALGGVYHIVTNRPRLDAFSGNIHLSIRAIARDAVGPGIEGVANVPLVPGRLAVRAVGYAVDQPGWIDDSARGEGANRARTRGGRVALRWAPDSDWTIDLGATWQRIAVGDSQYVLASPMALSRRSNFPEPNTHDFTAVSATVTGRLGGVRLLSASSHIDQRSLVSLDASALGPRFGVAHLPFRSDRNYDLLNQELRLTPAEGSGWLAGFSYMHARSRSLGNVELPSGPPVRIETLIRNINEFTLFGEATQGITRAIDVTLGARLFETITDDESAGRSRATRERSVSQGFSPSVSLDWRAAEGRIFYLRYARALRPGGLALAPGGRAEHFDADTLGVVDLGARLTLGRLNLTSSLYYSRWNDLQSDYLLPSGLVSTHTVGDAEIPGLEASADWRAGAHTRLSAGFTAQRPRLTRLEPGIVVSDNRLPVTPDFAARIALHRRVAVAGWTGEATLQANYTGRARLTFEADIDRKMGAYAVVTPSLAIARHGFQLSARLDNLFDVRGDSFAFGNPFSIRSTPQFTPVRPRTLTLAIGKSW